MGAANLELAHARWGHLRGDQWRALAWMALRSWDEGKQRNGDQARHFWAGQRSLAYGMGLTRGTDEELSEPNQERVRRTLRALEAHNSITVITPGKGRDAALIALHLELADVTHLDDVRPLRVVGVQ